MQSTYGVLLPEQDASLQSRSCSDMSTGTGLDAACMLLGGASSLEAASSLNADDRSAESSPMNPRGGGGDAPHLVFGAFDESDGALVRGFCWRMLVIGSRACMDMEGLSRAVRGCEMLGVLAIGRRRILGDGAMQEPRAQARRGHEWRV